MAIGQNHVPPVNIPIPTKIGSKMSGAPIPKWDPIGFDPQATHPQGAGRLCKRMHPAECRLDVAGGQPLQAKLKRNSHP